MQYAVLQTDLVTPTIDQLARAVRLVPGLTPYDASILGQDAFGILAKNFSAQQAAALQGALRIEGVETEIVLQTQLPAMPKGNVIHRGECTPQHLLIYDPLGQTFPLEWRHVLFIAAGPVRLTDVVRFQREVPNFSRPHNHAPPPPTFETRTREERNYHLLGEIIIAGGALRYSFTADKFNFIGLGARKTDSLAENYNTFIRDLIHLAPHAGLNRGAAALQQQSVFSYPTRNAFHEEIVWMLWQMQKTAV